jgi:hypothetical protein
MGLPVLIIAPSGYGKSASMRNIPDDIYSVVEVNGKPLPFRTKKKPHNTDSYQLINRIVTEGKADITVLDDTQYLMANEYMRRAKETGWEKFTEIGQSFWNLVNSVQKLPPQKIVYFLHHSETNDQGVMKAKTIGKMLDEKISIEGMFTIVFVAGKTDGKYYFATQSDGQTPAKTPIGMFADQFIDNDLFGIDAAIRAYYDLPEPASVFAEAK